MKPSPELEAFLKGWERLSLKLYICPAGYPTIGWGHKFEAHEPQPEVISQAEAQAYFDADLAEHAQTVDELVTVDLAQHEYDALVSFRFNTSEDAFRRSTLLRKVNERRYDDAAHEFARWVYAGKKKLLGLVKRRAAECAMFENADYSGRP